VSERATLAARGPRLLASEHGARLDADLRAGGGADDTLAVQRLLDRARDEGGAHVVVDGVARVSGLDVYSNTVLEGAPGAGLYLADGAERSIIRNAHRTRDAIVDENITIRGLRLSGNREGQVTGWTGGPLPGDLGWVLDGWPQFESDRSWKSPVQLLGVRGLVVERVEIRNARSFSFWIANVSNVEIRDLAIDVEYGPYPADASVEEQLAFLEATPGNLDGIHVNGPADHVLIDGVDICTRDDAISFCANDWGTVDLTRGDLSGPFAGQGPITDVVVRNAYLRSPSHGIRLLSADQRIDRVRVENVSGSVGMRAVLLSHFVIPAPGDIGSVAFHDVDLRAAPSLSLRDWFPDLVPAGTFSEEADSAFFVVNAAVEELSLTDVAVDGTGGRPVLLVGPDARVGSLDAAITVVATEGPVGRIGVDPGADVGRLALDIRLSASRSHDSGNPLSH
jgi:hypothetical protein